MAEALVAVKSIVLSARSRQISAMQRLKYISITLLGLAACTPVSLYYKPNVAVTRLNNDLLDCEVSALKDAPVASQIRRGPPRYIPGYHHCNSKGHCYRSGGYFVPGEAYSVDVNARLRHDLEKRCMGRKGYQLIELPRCSTGVSSADATAIAGQVPLLTENSCVVRENGGRWQIIDPAL
ncbi:MAG: hypothetical protein PVI41_01990 [Roseobacter sp.]|jgi:hypothetical protein